MTEPYYQDEHSLLYLGDSLAVLAELETDSVDAVITDPPYSSGGQFRGDRMGSTGGKYGGENFVDFYGDNRDQRAFLSWMGLWLGEVLRVAKPGAACLLFTDWRQLPTMTDALQVGGWTWRGVVPWVKSGSRPAFRQRAFLNVCEYVVWGTAGSSNTEDGSTVPLPGFYQCSAPRDRDHQTQKPIEVMRDLVKIVPPGDTVLDPFMGSGTTGVAAMIEGRRFIGCEMVPHFAEVAERRIREAQGQSVERPDGSVSFDFGGAA